MPAPTFQHTPGPWEWRSCVLGPVVPYDGPSRAVATILTDESGGMIARDSDLDAALLELDADRALIVAAPDLADALAQLREEVRRMTARQRKAVPLSLSVAIEKADAALERATTLPAVNRYGEPTKAATA